MLLTHFVAKLFKKSTIHSAWKAVGLIPFNPSIVLNQLPAPYFSQTSTPRHPDDDFEPRFDTPRNLEMLIQASYEIETIYPKAMNFHHFVKGALAVAREGRLNAEQLACTKATENARKLTATH